MVIAFHGSLCAEIERQTLVDSSGQLPQGCQPAEVSKADCFGARVLQFGTGMEQQRLLSEGEGDRPMAVSLCYFIKYYNEMQVHDLF